MKLYGISVSSFLGVELKDSLPLEDQFFIVHPKKNKSLQVIHKQNNSERFIVQPLRVSRTLTITHKTAALEQHKVVFNRSNREPKVIHN